MLPLCRCCQCQCWRFPIGYWYWPFVTLSTSDHGKQQHLRRACPHNGTTASLDVLHMTKFVECIRVKNLQTNSPADEAVKSTFLPLVANVAADLGETVRLDPNTGKLLTKSAEKLWSREYAKGRKLV